MAASVAPGLNFGTVGKAVRVPAESNLGVLVGSAKMGGAVLGMFVGKRVPEAGVAVSGNPDVLTIKVYVAKAAFCNSLLRSVETVPLP